MKISVIGGGYVGLVTGACLADQGHGITLIDIDEGKVGAINRGESPFYEPGLEALLKKTTGRTLKAETDFGSLMTSRMVFICVNTPQKPDGSPDLSFLLAACTSIGNALKHKKDRTIVVVKSTVPPFTTEKIVRPRVLAAAEKTGHGIAFAMNPEFLREGKAVEDFLHPDRIVIGTDDPAAGEEIATVYRDIPAPVIRTGIPAAEMIKYVSNAFLATRISFANEIGNICKNLGIDVNEVMDGVGYDTRIGRKFLNAGAGFGGSCLPKDLAALTALARTLGEDPVLLQSVAAVNDRQPARIIRLLEERIGPVGGKRVAVLGLAFKENTDDIRDSRSIPVIRGLLEKGAGISAYDPVATAAMRRVFPGIDYAVSPGEALSGADACIVMTEWPEFSRLDKEFDRMRQRIIIEARKILTTDGTEGICW